MNTINEPGLLNPTGSINSVFKPDKSNKSFEQTFKDALNEVNDLQVESKENIQKFLNGEITDVHQVMVAAEKASVGLDLTLTIRNKLLEAYREVMRMQG